MSRSADVGRLVADARRRGKLSQEAFAAKLGISRKTLSDLERGVAEHVSLRTALEALALAGFALEAVQRRPPTLSQVMAQRAAHQARVNRLTAAGGPSTETRSKTRRGARP